MPSSVRARTLWAIVVVVFVFLVGCPRHPSGDDWPASGFTDGDPPPPPPPPPVLECPGETQCPCSSGCAAPLSCGPMGACTRQCTSGRQCDSGVAGEACIGGFCIVPCSLQEPSGGCVQSGMIEAECFTISDTNVCGYP